MRVKIRSRFAPLAGGIAGRLRSAHGWATETSPGRAEDCELRCSPDIDPALLADLFAALRPIELVCRQTAELRPDQAEIDLADDADLSVWNVVVFGEEVFATEVARRLKALGFPNVRVNSRAYIGFDRMAYGGASAFARQVAAWELRQHGCHPEAAKEWPDSDHDIYLYVVAPVHRGVPARRVLPVSVVTDLGGSVKAVIEAVRQAGFGTVRAKVTDTLAEISHLGLDPGLLQAGADEVGIGLLLGIAQRFADAAGVDPVAFPVRRLPASSEEPKLYLPITAIRRGMLAPYAGPSPARFRLRLCTDDRAAGLVLTRAFAQHGFREVTKRAAHDLSQGFTIFYGPAADEPRIVELVRDTLEREMVHRGILGYPLSFLPGSDNDTIEVIAPFRACREGTLLRELANPKRFSLIVIGPGPRAQQIGAYAGELGFTSVEIRPAGGSRENAGWLEYGGAPRELVDKLRNGIAERFGEPMFMRARKRWAVTDMTIAINLPQQSANPSPVRRRLWRISGVRPAASPPDAAPFIEVSANKVRVGRVEMARPGRVHPMVPDIGALHPFCIDPKTAATLEFLAI
jgi:hypothetical protein